MKIYHYITLLGFITLFCSCSTVINTTTQEFGIKSTPGNAKLTIDGRKFGTCPQVVNIERGINHVVKLELAGYEPYEIQITTKLSPWVWTNILNGFVPGFTIDYLTGSLNDLYPDSVEVSLNPAPKVESPPKR